MTRFIIRRCLLLIPLLLLLSIVVFIIIQLPPGDYIDTYASQLQSSGIRVTNEEIEAYTVRYGLNQPLYVQYFKWIGRFVQGDLGYSFTYNKSVSEVISMRLGPTIGIALASIVLIWILAFPMGFYAATHQYSLGDYAFTSVSFFGAATPEFLLAIGIMYLYFLATGSYAGGLFSSAYMNAPWSWAKIADMLNHLWIPFLVIAVTGTAGLFKSFRANLLDEISKPYVKTARAKGVSDFRLLVKYPVRIALIPFISTVGWALPELISKQAILSMVLNLPTIGPLLIAALNSQDMYLAGSVVFIMGIISMIGTLISDILLALADPRIRTSM